MGQFHDNQFPGESEDYRTTRDNLLAAEMELRKQTETVAAMRRALPLGGQVTENYAFDEDVAGNGVQTTISDLLAPGKDSLVLYSFMYAPGGDACPACNAILDALNGSAPHIGDRVNLAVVAKAPIAQIRSWAQTRGWDNLRLLSSNGNSYNTDYGAEIGGSQLPAINVFRKTTDGIFHSYNAELLYAPSEEGQHPRHADTIWPLWSVFDLTPDGRGTDWFPRYSYD
ncbi:MAG: putative dithiol-disulfide oxidoreductase (DUF899 family) [Alphaproteobacteria bacterium]|jgi:predicted dithiol-disulfide oxidoreductase (DUF899 family)